MARMRSCGQARSRWSASDAQAGRRCSQLSSASSTCRDRSPSASVSASACPGCSRIPSAAAIRWGTSDGSDSAARSTHQTPSTTRGRQVGGDHERQVGLAHAAGSGEREQPHGGTLQGGHDRRDFGLTSKQGRERDGHLVEPMGHGWWRDRVRQEGRRVVRLVCDDVGQARRRMLQARQREGGTLAEVGAGELASPLAIGTPIASAPPARCLRAVKCPAASR